MGCKEEIFFKTTVTCDSCNVELASWPRRYGGHYHQVTDEVKRQGWIRRTDQIRTLDNIGQTHETFLCDQCIHTVSKEFTAPMPEYHFLERDLFKDTPEAKEFRRRIGIYDSMWSR